ncbi:MAG: hypothetical protein ACI8P0_006818, partial [Planctomycetaceae bacterium]
NKHFFAGQPVHRTPLSRLFRISFQPVLEESNQRTERAPSVDSR